MSNKNRWHPSKSECTPRGFSKGYPASRQMEELEGQPLRMEQKAADYANKGDRQFHTFLMKEARKFRIDRGIAY